jgi:hypothetical protein
MNTQNGEIGAIGLKSLEPGLLEGFWNRQRIVASALIAGKTTRSAPHRQLTAYHARSARNVATSPCQAKMKNKDH